MRIRSTKPEFWRSKTIAQLDWDTRLVLKALESYVDDNGVGKDSVIIFCADAFPHDLANSPEIVAKITRSLRVLCGRNLAVRYSIGGEALIYVRRWKQWQYIDRPNKGRHPRPDGTTEYGQDVDESIGAGQGVTDPVIEDPDPQPPTDRPQVAPNVSPTCPQNQSEEQRNRGTEKKNPPTPQSEKSAAGRAPAIRTTGAEKARDQFLAIPTNGSSLSRQIANAYSDSLPVPIEAKLLSDVGAEIDRCLRSAIPPDAIAAGIQEWTRSDSWSPSQIPKFVHKAANRSAGHNGVGKPTLKALDYDTAAEQLIAALETP